MQIRYARRNGNEENKKIRIAAAYAECIAGFNGMNVPSSDCGILIFDKEVEHKGSFGRFLVVLVFGQRFPLWRGGFRLRPCLVFWGFRVTGGMNAFGMNAIGFHAMRLPGFAIRGNGGFGHCSVRCLMQIPYYEEYNQTQYKQIQEDKGQEA